MVVCFLPRGLKKLFWMPLTALKQNQDKLKKKKMVVGGRDWGEKTKNRTEKHLGYN